MKPINIIKRLNESVDDSFDRFTKDLETALLDAGYKVDTNYDDGMVYMLVKRGDAGITVDLYTGGNNISDFEVDTIGIGGDNECEQVVSPVAVNGWDQETGDPRGGVAPAGEEVYSIFKDISKVDTDEVVSIINKSFQKAGNQNINEADDWKTQQENRRRIEREFADSIDPEPLFNKIREMVGDDSIQFKYDIKEANGTLYPRLESDNVVDKCGIFQLAIKECYIGTFSTGISFEDTGGNKDLDKPYWWGSIDLSYSSHSGGSNGMEILRFQFAKDGGWSFFESRSRN